MKKSFLLCGTLAILLLTRCGSSEPVPVWGGEATTDEEKKAKEVCECLNTAFSQNGVDVSVLVAHAISDPKTADEGEMKKKEAAFEAERAKAQAIKMDETECGKKLSGEIMSLIESKKLNEKKYQDALLFKCRLAGI